MFTKNFFFSAVVMTLVSTSAASAADHANPFESPIEVNIFLEMNANKPQGVMEANNQGKNENLFAASSDNADNVKTDKHVEEANATIWWIKGGYTEPKQDNADDKLAENSGNRE